MRCLLFLALAGSALPLSACSEDSAGSGSGGAASGSGSSGPGASGVGASGPGGAGSGGSTTGSGGGGGGSGGAGVGGHSGECGPDPGVPQEVLPDTTDPEAGDFTMDEALVGMPEGPGPLRATFVLQFGNIVCELLPDVAPIGVANFVGLGRGARPWRDPATKQWVKRPFYDGLVFHRIIDDFMAQGGDPLGTGAGGPGYKLTNASSDIGAEVSVPGTLAYANSGSPGSSGSQFYITEVATPWLDGDYIIFGHCTPLAVIDGLTSVPVEADGETPVDPPVIQYVTFTRCAPDAQ